MKNGCIFASSKTTTQFNHKSKDATKIFMKLQRTIFNSDSLIQTVYENETHFVFFEHTFADNETVSYPINSEGLVPMGYNVYPQFSLTTQAAAKRNIVARKWHFSADQKTVSIINFK